MIKARECGYNHPVGTRCPACADWPYAKGGAARYQDELDKEAGTPSETERRPDSGPVAGDGRTINGELHIYRNAGWYPLPATNQAGEVERAILDAWLTDVQRAAVKGAIHVAGDWVLTTQYEDDLEIIEDLPESIADPVSGILTPLGNLIRSALATQPATSPMKMAVDRDWLAAKIAADPDAECDAGVMHPEATQPATSQEGEDHGLGPHATVVKDGEDGFMPVAIVVGSNVYLSQGGRQLTMSHEQFAEIASHSVAATPTPDYNAAWKALSQPLSWMHDNPRLKPYWGWNLADIANDLIDKAYPGLRSGEIVGTTEPTVASADLLWQAANLVYRIEAAGAVKDEGSNFERWKTTARALGPKLRAARAQVQP